MIHMEGMGTEQTQLRSNRNLRREVAELPQSDVQQALCYTPSFYLQAIVNRGENLVPTEHLVVSLDKLLWIL